MTVAIADAVAATETPSPVSTSSNVAATKRVVRRSRGQTPARFTVELPRPQHRFLKRSALNEDSDASSVVRALLTLLKGGARRRGRGERHEAWVPWRLGRPMWVEDPDFELSYHLRHTALPHRTATPRRRGGAAATGRTRDGPAA
ncbi:MAG: wax ester/triacylglycerol synthase domain-containing protein [Solirubrobacteraceae bacterium]